MRTRMRLGLSGLTEGKLIRASNPASDLIPTVANLGQDLLVS